MGRRKGAWTRRGAGASGEAKMEVNSSARGLSMAGEGEEAGGTAGAAAESGVMGAEVEVEVARDCTRLR
jgi:hypothetical protein